MIKRLRAFYFIIVTLIIPILAGRSWAGGEGLDVPEGLERKVPLEGLSGIKLFFSKLYNENLLLYAVVCTVLMAIIGIAIAYLADAILKVMGLEVEKIEHKE